MCPDRSWKILLASALEILGLLISLMNLWEGREGSMFLNLAYLGDPNQSCLHLAFCAVFSACIDADLLRLSCFLSVLGRFAVTLR
jgi:hypothetical protein